MPSCRHGVAANMPCAECEIAADAAAPRIVRIPGRDAFFVVDDLEPGAIRGFTSPADPQTTFASENA